MPKPERTFKVGDQSLTAKQVKALPLADRKAFIRTLLKAKLGYA